MRRLMLVSQKHSFSALLHVLACGSSTIPFAVFPYVVQSGRMRLAGFGHLLQVAD